MPIFFHSRVTNFRPNFPLISNWGNQLGEAHFGHCTYIGTYFYLAETLFLFSGKRGVKIDFLKRTKEKSWRKNCAVTGFFHLNFFFNWFIVQFPHFGRKAAESVRLKRCTNLFYRFGSFFFWCDRSLEALYGQKKCRWSEPVNCESHKSVLLP